MWRSRLNLESRIFALEGQVRMMSEVINRMSRDMTIRNVWYPPASDPMQNMLSGPVTSVGKTVDAILSHLGLTARIEPPNRTDERIELRPAPSSQMK